MDARKRRLVRFRDGLDVEARLAQFVDIAGPARGWVFDWRAAPGPASTSWTSAQRSWAVVSTRRATPRPLIGTIARCVIAAPCHRPERQ